MPVTEEFSAMNPKTMLENSMYFRVTVLWRCFHVLVLEQWLIKPPFLTGRFSIFAFTWLYFSRKIKNHIKRLHFSFPKQNQAANDSKVSKRGIVVQCWGFFLAMLNSVRPQYCGNTICFNFKHDHEFSVQPIRLQNSRLTAIIF